MKRKLLRMAAALGMAMVFALALSGCNNDPEPRVRVTFRNNSSHETTVTMEAGRGWTPEVFTLQPNTSQVVTTNQSVTNVSAQFSNALRVQSTWNSGTNTYTFTNR